MSYEKAIERGIELLKLCQHFQSEKDGIDRPEPGLFDRTKTLDPFAVSIAESITYLSSLFKLLPMQERLTELGRELERQGKIRLDHGDEYSQAALDFMLAEHGLCKSSGVSNKS